MNYAQPFTLLVIDPQVDFVSGSLAVSDASEAMARLSSWGLLHLEQLEAIVLTSDQHPWNHCSFKSNGGIWPNHCVRYTEGAAITHELMPLLSAAIERGIPYEMVEKATTSERDAYSAFESEVPSLLRSATQIAVAGIAGDYCVLSSVKDLVKHGLHDKLYLLNNGIASIDNGTTLRTFVAEEGLLFV